jgi:2-isopropylmalate synthase
MAGADRVEGCMFGNGERTGNVDIVTLALNQYTQGISPGLDFSDIQECIDIVTQCNDLPIHPRYPYAGELVFTAFSGSHQDAIKKGFEAQTRRHAEEAQAGKPQIWDMPYLPIDPLDIGCNYEAIIRVNSQSGKGGISFLVKQHLLLDLPRRMQVAFYKVVQEVSDREAREMTVEDIVTAFRKTYFFGGAKNEGRLGLRSFRITDMSDSTALGAAPEDPPEEGRRFDGTILVDDVARVIRGDGNGPLSSLLDALKTHLEIDLIIREYSEHSVGEGSTTKAASYVELVAPGTDPRDKNSGWWGVGVDSDITGSGLRAVLSAVNSAIGDRILPELKLTVGFNEKSGQTDVASAILNSLNLELPRKLQRSFFELVQRAVRTSGGKISYEDLTELFKKTYHLNESVGRIALGSYRVEPGATEERRKIFATVLFDGEPREITGEGNGPLSALTAAVSTQLFGSLSIKEFSEHSIGEGSDTTAASYIELNYTGGGNSTTAWGVGVDPNSTASGLKAVLSAYSNSGVKIQPKKN